jgi:hypothetical protein
MAGNNHSTHDVLFPDWQPQFHAALLETDPQQLFQRVTAAEEVIFLRQQALVNSPTGGIERRATKDAINALLVVRLEKLNYLDWTKK